MPPTYRKYRVNSLEKFINTGVRFRTLNSRTSRTHRYLMTVLLGHVLAGAVIPQGYMPSVTTNGPLQIVFCSATDRSGISVQADDICTFSALHLVGLHSLPFDGLQDKCRIMFSATQPLGALADKYRLASARGPPAIS